MNAVLWTLNTVFLDGDVEKEGRNIEANVALLISAFQHPKGLREAGKHDDGLDAQLAALVAAAERRRPKDGPSTPEKTPSKGRVVRKALHHQASGAAVPTTVVPTQPQKDHRLAVRDLLYGAEQLSRSVPRRKAAAQVTPRCPHCKLFDTDPKFFEVPVTADGKTLHWSSGSSAAGKQVAYGNLTLGITSKELALDQLWLAVAKLQLPSYASLTSEQRAASCKEHFLAHIGVPPWMEHLLEAERQHRRQLDVLGADLDVLKERNAEVRNEIRRQQKFLQVATSLKDTMNQEHERTALLGQLAVAKAELVDKRWQKDEAIRKNARDKMHHNLETGLVALRTEESQRLLVSIAMMSDVLTELEAAASARPVKRSSVADGHSASIVSEQATKASAATIRDQVLDILGNIPSAEFGRSCRRSGGANKHPQSRYVQCKNCFLPLSYSPYCGVTGTMHYEQLVGNEPHEGFLHTSDELKLTTPVGSDEDSCGSEVNSDGSATPRSLKDIPATAAASMEASKRGSASVRSANGEGRRSLRRVPSTASARSMSNARAPEPPNADASKPKKRRRKLGTAKKGDGVDSHLGSPDSSEGFPVPITNNAVKSLGSIDSTDSAPDISASNDLFNLFASHTCRFVEAASRNDVASMKLVIDEVDSSVSTADQSLPQRFPATCAAIFDLEERFMEWIYALGLEPPPAQHSPPGTAHTASNFGPETDSGKLVRLKKEMRELQHAFAKRPNARSQGINLDEEAFAAVSFRTAELERRVNQLKVKLLASTSTTVPTSSVAVVTPAASTPGVHDAADPLTPSSKGPPQAVAMQSPKPQHLLQNPLGGARSVRMDYGSSAMF